MIEVVKFRYVGKEEIAGIEPLVQFGVSWRVRRYETMETLITFETEKEARDAQKIECRREGAHKEIGYCPNCITGIPEETVMFLPQSLRHKP